MTSKALWLASRLRSVCRQARYVLLLPLFWWLTGYCQGGALPLEGTASLPFHAATQLGDAPQSFRVLCYHDIRDNLRDSFATSPEATAMDTSDFINQLNWLHQNGYQPVSLQQIIDARAGKSKLPSKAILLTFDDGYKSVYTKVFPLLKQFNFPAVVAVVGDWMDAPSGSKVKYGDDMLPRERFVSWDELREMQASGLIEVASHSHDLHKGIVANPQGNQIPAAIARGYSASNQSYENDAEYSRRIGADLQRSAALIRRHLGSSPRAMVWPYGMYNIPGTQLAADAGMPVTMNLEPGPNTPEQPLSRMRRTLMTYSHGLPDLIELLRQPASYAGEAEPRERIVHVDLDYVFDPDPSVQEANLSKLLDRLQNLQPTTVYLQAYADPDGDGVADSLYFPNRHLPVRADLFSRTAWQLKTRVGVRVYAWMPVLAFKLPVASRSAAALVEVMPGAPAAATENRYHRLTPFDPAARRLIAEIYEDLGKHAVFQGVLFHDDATLSDYEDASPMALAFYRQHWHLPDSLAVIRNDPAIQRRWSAQKTVYLNAFTLELAASLRHYHPALLTARNLYAQPVLNPASEEWFAQSLSSFLNIYDFTAVMAMPYMERAANPEKWLLDLICKIKEVPGALNKTVFELQSRDWNTGQSIPSKVLASQLRLLHLQGARHLGYYPDDFHQNAPEETVIKPVISVRTNPMWR